MVDGFSSGVSMGTGANPEGGNELAAALQAEKQRQRRRKNVLMMALGKLYGNGSNLQVPDDVAQDPELQREAEKLQKERAALQSRRMRKALLQLSQKELASLRKADLNQEQDLNGLLQRLQQLQETSGADIDEQEYQKLLKQLSAASSQELLEKLKTVAAERTEQAQQAETTGKSSELTAPKIESLTRLGRKKLLSEMTFAQARQSERSQTLDGLRESLRQAETPLVRAQIAERLEREETLLKVQTHSEKSLRYALAARELQNYEFLSALVRSEASSDETEDRDAARAVAKEFREILAQEKSGELSTQEAAVLSERLEELRLQYERDLSSRAELRDFHGKQEAVDVKRVGETRLGELTRAEAQRRLREILAVIPTSERERKRKAAGSGDRQALLDYASSLPEAALSPELQQLQSQIQTMGEQASELDLLEMYTLTAGRAETDAAEEAIVELTNSETDAKNGDKVSERSLRWQAALTRNQERISQLKRQLGQENIGDNEFLRSQLRQSLEQLTRVTSESDQNFRDYYQEAMPLLDYDLQESKRYASPEHRLQQLRLDLQADILRSWKEANLTGETPVYSVPDMLRARLAQYELIELNFDNPELGSKLAGKLQEQRNNPAQPTEIAQIVQFSEISRKLSRLGQAELLERWSTSEDISQVAEWLSPPLSAAEVGQLPQLNIEQRKQLWQDLQRSYLELAIDTSGDNTQREAIRATWKQLSEFQAQEVGLDKRIATLGGLESDVLRNTVFINLCGAQADLLIADQLAGQLSPAQLEQVSASLKTELARLATTAGELNTLQISNALLEFVTRQATGEEAQAWGVLQERFAQLASGIAQLEATETDSEDNVSKDPLADIIAVERIPGGLGVRVLDKKFLNLMLGMSADYDIAGFSISADKMTNDGLKAGLALYHGDADFHEISHLLEQMLRSESAQQLDNSTFAQSALPELVARLQTTSDLETSDAPINLAELAAIPSNYLEMWSKLTAPQQESLVGAFRSGRLSTEAMTQAGLPAETVADFLTAQQEVQLNYTIAALSKDLLRKAQAEGYGAAEIEQLRQTLSAILYEAPATDNRNADLANVLTQMVTTFGDFRVRGNNGAETTLFEYYRQHYEQIGNTTSQLALAAQLFNDIAASERDILFASPSASSADTTQQLARFAAFGKIGDFALTYSGVQREQRVNRRFRSPLVTRVAVDNILDGADSADNLSWDRILDGDYRKVVDNFGARGNFKNGFTIADLTINRENNWSYFGENEPVLFPIINRIPFASATINNVIRMIAPWNTRDIAGALSGSKLGRQMGIPNVRSSSIDKVADTFLGKPFGMLTKQYFKGWIEESRTQGLSQPDFIRNIQLKDRHEAAIRAISEKLNGKVSQSEVYSFLENHPLMQLELVPGDRPNFNPEISEKKAESITEFDLRRIANEVTNLSLISRNKQEKLAYGGGSFNTGAGDSNSYTVSISPTGNLLMNRRGETPRLLSPQAVVNEQGSFEMKKVGDALYKNWRPQEVFYKGSYYYVHYDPKTGLPGLYNQEAIDWTSRRVPAALHDDGTRVDPRFAEGYKRAGTERHKANMDIAVSGLMEQILNARERQRQFLFNQGWPAHQTAFLTVNPGATTAEIANEERIYRNGLEQNLYSIRDLIRSVKYYEDPYSSGNSDPNFAPLKSVNGIRFGSITIPDLDPATGLLGTPREVDYEVANELLTRIDRFYIHDRVTKGDTVVKTLSPEHIQRESELFSNTKIRQMFRGYLRILNSNSFARPITGGGLRAMTSAEIEANANRLSLDAGFNEARMAGRLPANDPDLVFFNDYVELKNYETLLSAGNNALLDLAKLPNGSMENFREEQLRAVRDLIDVRVADIITRINAVRADLTTPLGPISAAEEEAVRESYVAEVLNKEGVQMDNDMNVIGIHIDNLFGQSRVENPFATRFAREISAPRAAVAAVAAAPGVDPVDAVAAAPGTYGLYESFDGQSDYMNVIANLTGGTGFLQINEITGAPFPTFTDRRNPDPPINVALGGTHLIAPRDLINANYDKRTFVRFMERLPARERERLSNDILGGINDNLKYRQEMKDYTLRAMNLVDYFNHDFMKYRLSKGIWENLSKWTRRAATITMYATLASMALTGSTPAFYVFLAAFGFHRYITPMFDARTAISSNRRNVARELTRKMRSEASRILQKLNEGGVLTAYEKNDLEEMLVEYEIEGEKVQSIGVPEGWSPNQPAGIGTLYAVTLGEMGLNWSQLISSGKK